MKKYIFLFIVLLINQVSFGQLTVSWPIDRAVFQRDNSGNANIIIAGQGLAAPWPSNWQLQYQIMYMNKFGTETSTQTAWTAITNPGVGKVFRVNKSVPTGWYRLYVRIMQNGTSQITSFTLKFGVGEVFVIAGQSNSVGEGSPGALSEVNLDCVMASAQTDVNKCSNTLPIYPVLYSLGNSSVSKISPNGNMPWAYKRLGNLIADKESGKVIPTLFFNTGVSGTSAENWSASANNTSIQQGDAFGVNRCSGTTNGNGLGIGEPFRTFRNSLNYYGSLFGLRGVIWHQGESDTKIAYINNPSYTINDYVSRVNFVIQKSRDYFNSNLSWAVSNVSMYALETNSNPLTHNIYTSNNIIITAQSQIRLGSNVAAAALASDNYIDWTLPINGQGNYNGTITQNQFAAIKRQGDRQHFTASGLIDLANGYYNNFITTTYGFLNKPSIPANPLVPVIITQVGSNKSIALDFAAIGKSVTDFSCFQWTQGDNYTNAYYPPLNCGSYSPLTVSVNSNWRCYMQDIKGNVYMTQKLTINTSSSFRLTEPIINSKVYPNPTMPDFENMIEFALEKPSNVRLEIVDNNGKLLQTLTDNIHAIGKFQYPFTLKKATFRDFETLYYRITVDDVTETKKIILTK